MVLGVRDGVEGSGGCTERRAERATAERGGPVGGWGGMSALLTFHGRHVGWQRGASAEEDGKAVKCKYYMRVG